MLHSVRFRATVIAVVATAVALVAAAILMLVVVRSTLTNEIDRGITNRAWDIALGDDVTGEIGFGAFPNDPETFAGVIEFFDEPLMFETDDGSVTEFVDEPFLSMHNDDDPDVDELISALTGLQTANSVTLGRISIVVDRPVSGAVGSITLTEGADNLRLVATDAVDGFSVVVVARTLDGVDRILSTIRLGAYILVPLLTALVGGLVWLLTGRALRPVEAIRREAELISATDLSRRVTAGEGRDEIARLGTTVNQMLDRIDTGQERQRRFAADAAHELRSPLASMRALLDVDMAHPETVSWERSIERLSVETTRMQRLVEDLLVMTRVEAESAGRQSLVDMDDIVLAEAASQRSASCTIDVSGVSACTVRGNPEQLRRVINNLVSNAVRHAATTVALSCSSSGEFAQVIIDDDGSGVAPEHRERIFERFERLDEARGRDAGGTGLGLALAREVTLAHGGTLTVDSSPTAGARFTLTLPAV